MTTEAKLDAILEYLGVECEEVAHGLSVEYKITKKEVTPDTCKNRIPCNKRCYCSECS